MSPEPSSVPVSDRSSTPVSVVLAGGGSAGHTSPLIATADAIRAVEPETRITCLGTAQGLETEVIPAAGYDLELIPPVPLPRAASPALLRVPGRLGGSVRAARRILRSVQADVLVGFGGYVSTPAYLAARSAGVPVVAHEGNARPGLANQVAARFCTHDVFTSFADTKLPHATFLGLPVRGALRPPLSDALHDEGLAEFGLAADRPVVVVTGGSQGARRLNEAFAGAAADLDAAGVAVLHLVGPRNDDALPAGAGAAYRTVRFTDRMDLVYAVADLVVCRAGANTVTEVSGLGLPAVYVPLPHGNGEQRENAAAVVAAGGALLVDDAALTADWVRSEVPALVHDPVRLSEMSRAAGGTVRTDAAERLAAIVLAVAHGRHPGPRSDGGAGTDTDGDAS